MPSLLRVAVLCGGTSSERDVSLKSGQQVFTHLDTTRYQVSLIILDTFELQALLEAVRGFDVVFLALHGKDGEDGRVQAVLDLASMPYTGSGVLASALCMDKAKTRKFLEAFGIVSPWFLEVRRDSLEVLDQITYPCFVKPNASGSSMGMRIVKEALELLPALEQAFLYDTSVLIDEYVAGREFTCGVMGNASRGGKLEAMPVIEIVPEGAFFDHHAKYTSKITKELCPAPLKNEETAFLQAEAMRIHRVLGCDGVSRSDFLWKEGTWFFLETNTIPGLTAQSLCPKAAATMGLSFTDFLTKQIEFAWEKRVN